MDINYIINQKFNTNKGYLYLIDLIKEKFPTFAINYDNLSNLKIEKMTIDEFYQSGYVGVYNAKTNTIKILVDIESLGIEISQENILDTFTHEFIHAISSKIDLNEKIILEGFNMRTLSFQPSFLVGINEGITQMITNELLEIKSDAYPFHTLIAYQLLFIVGKDKLLEYYSNNDIEGLGKLLLNYNLSFDLKRFAELNYYMYFYLNGENIPSMESVGTEIQKMILELTEGLSDDEKRKFASLIIDEEKAKLIMQFVPRESKTQADCGLKDIQNVKTTYLNKLGYKMK